MFRVLAGLVVGYLIYTPDGKKTLNNAGNYIKNSIKSSIDEINKNFIKNNKDNKNERTDRNIQANDERSITGKNVCAEGVGLQKDSSAKVNGIYINSAEKN